ncbi:hypothetical protein FRC08_013917 [Ceratobasidium sp. 394]|nr:hypothetical protein FRC08_013917 [Ceratobasidium sp. 394]
MSSAVSRSKLQRQLLQAKLLPKVAALPENLTDEHRAFWNQLIGEPFRNRIMKRGTKSSNGRTWTQDQFIGPFCDEVYPSLSSEARTQYEVVLGQKVYAYLTNHSNRKTEGVKPKPSMVAKQRIYGHDIWRQENPEAFDELMKQYETDHPDVTLNVGSRRSLTIRFFGTLPPSEQTKYREMAAERLKVIRSLCALSGDEKANYIDRFIAQHEALLKEADRVAGIKVNSQVLYQDQNDDYNIRTIVTESMADLEDAPEVDQIVTWIKSWVRVTANQDIKPKAPQPAITPDLTRDKFPLVPPIGGLKLADMQKIHRQVFTKLWNFGGGHGKVPWEMISADLDAWIAPDRRPPGVGFGDPNDLRMSVVVTWLEYFILCQTGAIPPERYIQFSKTLAGPHPIDPALSQESSRRLETIAPNKECWVLEFDKTITSCHAPGGMQYDDESLEYAKFLDQAKATAAAAARSKRVASQTAKDDILPEHHGLPTGPANLTSVIDGQEKALLTKWCSSLPAECSSVILELIDAINDLQAHLPASTPSGIWVGEYANAMPALLPLAPDALIDGLQFFVDFWLPIGYFVPRALAEPHSRFRYIHLWFEDMLELLLIRHAPTKTLVGERNGAVWIARAIIKLILNFAAINGDFTPPMRQPDTYDISQFPLDEYTTVLGWGRQLLATIQSSIKILAQTLVARQSEGSLATQPLGPETDVTPSQAPVIAARPPSHPPPTSVVPRTKKVPKTGSRPRRVKGRKKRTGGGSGSDEAISGDSDKSSDEQDFDTMDRRPGDDDEFNPDGFSYSANDMDVHMDEDGAPHSSAHLADDCFKIFHPLPPPPDDTEHVLGPFPILPAASLDPLPKSYPALITVLVATIARVEAALRAWGSLAQTNTTSYGQEIRDVKDATCHLPGPIQPLAQLLLARRRAWSRAKITAPAVLQFVPHLAETARAALQLDIAVSDFDAVQAQAATTGDLEREELDKHHRRLLKGTVELCWVYKELRAFHDLTTEWAKDLPGSVFDSDDTILTSGPALYAVVQPLLQWSKAASKLDERSRTERKAMWRSLGRPFEKKHNAPLWYCFGSPRAEEIPNGLEGKSPFYLILTIFSSNYTLIDHLKVIDELNGHDEEENVGIDAPTNPTTSISTSAPPMPSRPRSEALPPTNPEPPSAKDVGEEHALPTHSPTDEASTSVPTPSPSAPSSSTNRPKNTQSRAQLKLPEEPAVTRTTRAITQAAVVESAAISSQTRKGRTSEGTAGRGTSKKRRR